MFPLLPGVPLPALLAHDTLKALLVHNGEVLTDQLPSPPASLHCIMTAYLCILIFVMKSSDVPNSKKRKMVVITTSNELNTAHGASRNVCLLVLGRFLMEGIVSH